MRVNSSLSITVDVATYLTSSSRCDQVRATSRDQVEATCPFHADSHPSFAVNEDNGRYRCLGCGAAGDFIELHRHLFDFTSRYEAEQDLIVRFGHYIPSTTEPLELDFGDGGDDVNAQAIAALEALEHLGFDTINSEYLMSRGISFGVQECYGIREVDGHVLMPWYDRKCRLVTVKHRAVMQKAFWYDPPTKRLKSMLYGLHLAADASTLVITEAEIDALSVVQAGIVGVALGGSSFSAAQARLIRNHRCTDVVVFTDNDEAGRKVRAQIVDKLVGHKRVSVVDWSDVRNCKDANDVLRNIGKIGVEDMVHNAIPIGLPLKFEK